MKTVTIAAVGSKFDWYRLGHHRGKKLAYIKRLCAQIATAFHPERIILFGSQAYGKPTADSDVDLLVVMPYRGRHTTQAIRILQHLDVLAPLDLLVRSPEEVRERLEKLPWTHPAWISTSDFCWPNAVSCYPRRWEPS